MTKLIQLAGSDEERLLLCQLYESSALLAQLGALVNEGIARLAASQGKKESGGGIGIKGDQNIGGQNIGEDLIKCISMNWF